MFPWHYSMKIPSLITILWWLEILFFYSFKYSSTEQFQKVYSSGPSTHRSEINPVKTPIEPIYFTFAVQTYVVFALVNTRYRVTGNCDRDARQTSERAFYFFFHIFIRLVLLPRRVGGENRSARNALPEPRVWGWGCWWGMGVGGAFDVPEKPGLFFRAVVINIERLRVAVIGSARKRVTGRQIT